jgi:hypothetical protein
MPPDDQIISRKPNVRKIYLDFRKINIFTIHVMIYMLYAMNE